MFNVTALTWLFGLMWFDVITTHRLVSTGSSASKPWPRSLQGTCTPTCPTTTLPQDCTTSPSPSWWGTFSTQASISIHENESLLYGVWLRLMEFALIYNISYFKDGLVNPMNNSLAINSGSSTISSAHSTNPNKSLTLIQCKYSRQLWCYYYIKESIICDLYHYTFAMRAFSEVFY